MSSLGSCTSLTMTRAQPAARAARMVTMPIGPAPITTARSPGWICALVAACTPTASGSTIAPAASETLSGSLKVKSAGWTTVGRRMPCTGGVAQKRTAGSRLYLPRRAARLDGSGMPGSMQTRSPSLSPRTSRPISTTTPAASWPRIIGALTTNGPMRPWV